MEPEEYIPFSLKDLAILPKLNLQLKNFDTWNLVVGPILARYGMIPILDGTAVRPNPDAPGLTAAQRNQLRASEVIYRKRVSDALLLITQACKDDEVLLDALVNVDRNDPAALWRQLNILFRPTTLSSKLNTDEEFNKYLYVSGGSVSPRDYVTKFRGLQRAATNAGNVYTDAAIKLRFLRQATSGNQPLRLNLQVLMNLAYPSMDDMWETVIGMMEDSLEALTVADTKSQAAVATPTNSALLSNDSRPYNRSWRGRGNRGHFNPHRGRPYGPRCHARGYWHSERSKNYVGFITLEITT